MAQGTMAERNKHRQQCQEFFIKQHKLFYYAFETDFENFPILIMQSGLRSNI